jgi:hypothetical protein
VILTVSLAAFPALSVTVSSKTSAFGSGEMFRGIEIEVWADDALESATA